MAGPGRSRAPQLLTSHLLCSATSPLTLSPTPPHATHQGLRKPAPESFAAVVDHLGLPPHRLLFVDDRQVGQPGCTGQVAVMRQRLQRP